MDIRRSIDRVNEMDQRLASRLLFRHSEEADRKTTSTKHPNMNKLKYLAALMIGIAGLGLQQANAFTSDLNTGNTAISGFTGPYGTVTISLDATGTVATVTFTSNTVGGNIYLFGDGGSVALNVNASSFTVSGITASNGGTGFLTTNADYSFAGAGQEDGFGQFNLTINGFDGFSHSADTISFTLTNTSGTTWTDSTVLAFNATGFDAAAHIFVTSSPANRSNGAIATGFAGEGPGTVPDGGATVMLLGAALGALGMVRRYLKS